MFFCSHPILVVQLYMATVLNRNKNKGHVQPIHNDDGISVCSVFELQKESNVTEQYICTGVE